MSLGSPTHPESRALMGKVGQGSVIYGVSQSEGRHYIDFWIKEELEFLEKISEKPSPEFRVGALLENQVLLIVVLFRLMPNSDIYETFWDYSLDTQACASAGRQLFEAMATEASFSFFFFDAQGNFHSLIEAPNILRAFFQAMIQQAASLPPWTRETFQKTQEALLGEYPTREALWEHLSKQKLQL